MPSKSQAQARFMQMVAHDPKAAKRVGVSQSVGKEFAMADIGRKIGGLPQHVKPKGKHR